MEDQEIYKQIYPRAATVTAAVCAILFCIVGVIGNLITFLALIQCPKLRKHATTAFVLSLSVSDLLFCMVNLPLTASRYIYEQWIFGAALCQMFPVIFYGNVAVSVLSMVAITINRYLLISCNSLYSHLYSVRSICAQLFFIWAFAFGVMLPPLLGVWGRIDEHKQSFSCTILKDEQGRSPKTMIFLLGFLLPCIVIILSYSCIYWKVRKSRRKIRKHEQVGQTKSVRRQNREKEDSRLTRLMLIIFLCFIICFLPLMLVNVFEDDMKFPSLHVMASVLAWLSSVINPFIYAASNRQYRSAYKKLFDNVKSSMGRSNNNFTPVSLHSVNTMKSGIADVRSVQMNTTSVQKEVPHHEIT